MTTNYQSILQQQASAPLATRNTEKLFFIPLPSYGVISVTGEEATRFLQNLLTNDVNQLSQQASQISAMCNPKGRLLALFILVKTEEGYLLVLPKSQSAFLSQRLQMFKLRSKVEVTDCSETLQVCGLQGTDLPETAIDLPLQPRALLIGSDEQIYSQLEVLLNHDWQLAAETSWYLKDIEMGIPLILPESREMFTAQQINLDLIGGVSFRKGCYPGQEVVARLHYLGDPKRRLFQAFANAMTTPEIGEAVVDNEKSVIGHIVNAVQGNDTQLFLQLSLKLEGVSKELYLNNGTALQQIQPYVA